MEFDSSKAIEWQQNNVQKPWWRAPNRCSVTILSEWCLLREIIWALQLNPIENGQTSTANTSQPEKFARFFSLNSTTNEINVNLDVSLTNMSAENLQSILLEFAAVATKLYRFRQFFAAVFQPPTVNQFLESVQLAPHSVQCYANGLDDFFRIISTAICDLEIELIQQDFNETYTVIYLYNRLLPHFRMINILYDIHQNVYIDFKTNAGTQQTDYGMKNCHCCFLPLRIFYDSVFSSFDFSGYVCAAYLFAGLISEMETTAIVERINMATSLLLASIRFYLSVFNSWWIEGRFDDWCSEFLIEKR